MYKNQLQELAQRSCFNLPSYSCVREGPDHAPRFKATVNFNGETFESPSFCSTLRQAEHAAAEVALHTLACRGPSRALATRVLDETGVYKNLLQETAHRAGLKLPVYTTIRTGPGHVPIFSCTVELAGMSFTGEAARTKKQAQKNAAITAWSSLKRLVQHSSPSSSSPSSSSSSSENVKGCEEQEQVVIARFLASIKPTDMKNFKPNVSQVDLTRPASSLHPLQYPNWAYPAFPPQMAIYQMWQQEHLLQLQNQFSSLQLPPSPAPRFFPYMSPILPPNSHLVVPITEQDPVPANPRFTIASSGQLLCFPENYSGKSTVTIQEIHEEKTEELPECSPSMPLDPPVQLQSIQLRGNQTEQIGRPSSTDVDFRVQNPQSIVSSRYIAHQQPRSIAPPVMIRNTRPRPPSAASPVQVRNISHVSSVTRQPHMAARVSVPPRMRTGNPLNSSRPLSPRFMAPAVRIRSVVPVCSAPPARKMPTAEPEGALAGKDRKDAVSEEKST